MTEFGDGSLTLHSIICVVAALSEFWVFCLGREVSTFQFNELFVRATPNPVTLTVFCDSFNQGHYCNCQEVSLIDIVPDCLRPLLRR